MDSQKNHHTVEIFIEATKNETNEEMAHIKQPKYSKLSKGEHKCSRGSTKEI